MAAVPFKLLGKASATRYAVFSAIELSNNILERTGEAIDG
jgi:hypothetical protein